jgi:hypothetical protein
VEKIYNDEIHNLYSLPNIVRVIKSRRIKWAGHLARMEKGRDVYRILVTRLEGKRLLGRPKLRREDNIKMGRREMGIDGANWIQLDKDRVQCRAFVKTIIILRVLQEGGTFSGMLSDCQLLKYPAPYRKYCSFQGNFFTYSLPFFPQVPPISRLILLRSFAILCLNSAAIEI